MSPTSAASPGTYPNVTLPASCDLPPTPDQAVWLIFGASGHLGRSLTQAVHSHNDLVSAIGHSYHDSLPAMQEWHTHNFSASLCDVRLRPSVAAVFAATLRTFGRVDVIAICHGYGVVGACEDQDEYEIRNQFETNVLGTLNVVQESLPYFRARDAGRYLIYSSTSGALGVPGLGPYCATKYAVEGLVESMLYEVDCFNVKLTLVIAGHMRRDDGAPITPGQDEQMPHTAGGRKYGHFRVLKPSASYAGADSPSAHAQRMLQWIGDHQPTSAHKAAELVWQLGRCRYPPLRLLLGTFAVESIRDRLKSITEEIEDWKELHFAPVEGMEGSEDEEHEEEE